MTSGGRNISVIIDTGACHTLVFSDILVDGKRVSKKFEGVGHNVVSRELGVIVTDLFSAKAYYIEQDKPYDAILGLDWMIEHHANINIMKLTLEYD